MVIEYLECIGGPLDGERLSSVAADDQQPWGDAGQYVRTPGRYVRAYRADPRDPLARLLEDAWIWQPPPGGAHA